MTAVGGSRLTLNRDNQRTGEVAWNDLKWLSALTGRWCRRRRLLDRLATPAVPGRPAANRQDGGAVPDVAAVASNLPGWPVVFAHHWVIDGGTSGATPLIATAMAILSADQRRHGQPTIGPPDGLFYELAGDRPSSFWDIVHGNNRYLSRVPWFRAKRGYDLASGLGVPSSACSLQGFRTRRRVVGPVAAVTTSDQERRRSRCPPSRPAVVLDRLDVGGSGALGALFSVVADLRAFGE